MAYGIEAARIFLLYVLPFVLVTGSLAMSGLILRRMKQLDGKVVHGEEELRSATSTWARSMSLVGKEIEGVAEAAKRSSTDSNASAATRRKVLKMHRLGNSVEQIAKALRLSKGEVTLLLKVHAIILQPFEQPPDARAMEQKP
jgi:hypothetical protein